jgi:hypothetical protein
MPIWRKLLRSHRALLLWPRQPGATGRNRAQLNRVMACALPLTRLDGSRVSGPYPDVLWISLDPIGVTIVFCSLSMAVRTETRIPLYNFPVQDAN